MSGAPRIDPDVTLVIPTLGRPILRRMLAAVTAGGTWPARVIIVDQGRRPEIAAFAEEARRSGLEVLYLPTGSTGKSAGLNEGIAHVQTRFLAIVDDDCIAAPDWMERVGERLRRHASAVVTGRVEAGDGEVQLSVVTSETEEIQRRPRLRFDRLSGGNMAMSLEVAGRIGPFVEDPCMRAAEDTEYAYRTLRSGVPIVYAPEVVVQHVGWRDLEAREDRYRNYALSQGGFFGWYLRRGDLFIGARAIVHLMRAMRRWLTGVLRGDVDVASNGRAYVVSLWPGLVAGWRNGARR